MEPPKTEEMQENFFEEKKGGSLKIEFPQI